jgi:hypothetical protein
MVMWP